MRSQTRYQEALQKGWFDEEIVSVAAGSNVVTGDEQPRTDTTLERLSELRPAFDPEGTVTAGNAPGVNDGATAVLLMERERATAAGLTPLAR